MNDKSTSNEASEPSTVESEKEKPNAPRVKTLLTGGMGVKSGVRAGGLGPSKLPPALSE